MGIIRLDRKKKHIINESRRAFLKTGGAVSAGLVLGFYLPSGCTTDTDKTTAGSFVPNAWLKVGNDDLVTITLAKSEMGHFLAFAVTTGALGFWGVMMGKRTESGRRILGWMKVHTPIFGTMFIDAVMTRSMRILSTMVNTGVSLLEALEVMRISNDNYLFRTLWTNVDARIRDGYQLSDAIMLSPYNHLIAPGILQMLRAGEKSGQIGMVCDRISVFLEKKLQNSIRTGTALIEPLMIILMGGIIGTIAIALLLPVFKVSSVMAH